MKIGIIGATGMIGHHTALAVQKQGHELLVIHRESSNLSTISNITFKSKVADLNDNFSLIKALANLDAVINCAAYYPTKPLPWKAEVQTAIAQMENFFAACTEVNLEKIVYLGGAIALPKHPEGLPGNEELIYSSQPIDKTPYLQVKWALDKLAREKAHEGLPVVIGIPSMCFGEFDYVPTTGKLIVDIANQKLPGYIRGDRNVIYAGDAGRGLLLACEKGRVGERYLFTGTNISMDDLVKRIAGIANVTPPKRIIPLPVARLVSQAQELKFKLLGGEVPKLSSTAIAVLALGQFLDGSKAQNELGFKTNLDLNQTIKRTIDWFRSIGYVSSPDRVKSHL
jgi:dihydroflavonol-4-reductase